MENRAETAAMEAYPPKFVTPKRGAKRIQSEKVDTHAPTRAIYRKGYELAEKEIKDALLEWVKLAYGKVSMNPFDCSEAFEELINKIDAL